MTDRNGNAAGETRRFRMTEGLMPIVVYAKTFDEAKAIYAERMSGAPDDGRR